MATDDIDSQIMANWGRSAPAQQASMPAQSDDLDSQIMENFKKTAAFQAPVAVQPSQAQASSEPVGAFNLQGFRDVGITLMRGMLALEKAGQDNYAITHGGQQEPYSDFAKQQLQDLSDELQSNIDASNAFNANHTTGGAITRLGGNIIASAPLAEMLPAVTGGPMARAGLGALQGGANSLLLSGASDAPVGQQVAVGSALGGILGPAAPYVEKVIGMAARPIIRAFKGAPQEAVQAGDNELLKAAGISTQGMAPEVAQSVTQEAQTQKAVTGALDADALARKANLENLGLKPTDSMVSRDPMQWTRERELAKMEPDASGFDPSKPLRDTYTQNNAALKGHLAAVGEKTGGAAQDAYDAGNSVINAIKAKWDEWQGDVSQAYQAVRQQIGESGAVKPESLLSKLDEHSDETAGAPIVDSVKKRLIRLGVLDKEGNTAGNLSIKNAEEVRKFIAHQGGNDPASSRIRTALQNSLDDDILKQTGSDVFAQARQTARERFQQFQSSKALEDIVSGKATPDRFLNNYVVSQSTPAQDLNSLREALTTGNNLQMQRGGQAWDDLRQQTADWILNKATNGNPKEGIVSFDAMKKALAQIGPQKLGILFGDDGAQKYAQLLAAAHDSTVAPIGNAVNRSNTSSAVFNQLTNMAKKAGTAGNALGIGSAVAHNPVLGVALHVGGEMAKKGAEKAQKNAMQTEVNNLLRGSAVPAGVVSQSAPVNPLLRSFEIPAAIGATNALMAPSQ